MKIYTKQIAEEKLKELILLTKTGKYKEIGDEILRKELLKILTNNPKLIDVLEKPATQKKIVKEIKRILHPSVGVFGKTTSVKEHLSTKERDYVIYKQIFAITNRPESIVDLGAGLNPLAYKELGCKPVYTAYEINQVQVNQINEFFKQEKIEGKAHCKDVASMKAFPKADMYFLFQFLDSLEQTKGHKLSERVLDAISATWIIVSFSTKTLSGKPMNVPERRWFNLLLERKGWQYHKLYSPSEIFYCIQK